MEPHRNPAQFVRDLTHDLSSEYAPRAARASKASAKVRISRLRSRLYFILQCSLGAGLSWWLAQTLLGHTAPYLSPVTAIVCLGLTFGQRWRRAFEVTLGVATGVLVGSVFAHFFGSGVWQIVLVGAAGMMIASLLGGGALISSQSAVQGIVVVTVVGHPEYGFDRWLDALIGAGVALVAAAIAPAKPVEKPRDIAVRLGERMADVVQRAIDAYRANDLEAATAALHDARESESMLDQFETATKEGLAVVRHSPLRRRQRDAVRQVADVAAPIDRAVRNIRVLVRRINTAIWRSEPIEEPLADAVDELAAAMRGMSESARRSEPLATWRPRLAALGEDTNTAHMQSLSSAVIIAQVRSIVVDLLEVTGLTYEASRDTLTPYTDD